jgi:hypothetical protein
MQKQWSIGSSWGVIEDITEYAAKIIPVNITDNIVCVAALIRQCLAIFKLCATGVM